MNWKIDEKFKFAGVLILLGGILLAWWIFFGGKSEQKNQEGPILQVLQEDSVNTTKLKINEAILNVEVADTQETMEKGLGDREKIDSGQGMWFVFPFEGAGDIWMENMKFPLDVVWFDKNLKVVGLKENATPESYPEIFYSPQNALYVLEVGIGFVNEQKIKMGDSAKIISPTNE